MALPSKTTIQLGGFSSDGSPWARIAAKSGIELDALQYSADGSPWHGVEEGITGYTITAGSGSFAHTGIVAALLVGHVLAASAGNFTLTGRDANLLQAHKITASAGVFNHSGQSANLLKWSNLTASTGTYSLTGQSAIVLSGRKLPASVGTFTLTGFDVSFVSRDIKTWNGIDISNLKTIYGLPKGLVKTFNGKTI